MENDKETFEEQYDPYCKICGSCGHEDCCSFITCFRSLIKNDKCDNGEVYLNDAVFAYTIMQLADEVINNLENGLYDAKIAVEKYRNEWNEIFNRIYNQTAK